MAQVGGHNDKLDLFKCISIYAVVLAHIPLPGQFGWALCALAKFSVVLFFLTAGYFSYEKSPRVLARRAAKTGWLLLVTSAALLLFGCVLALRQGQTVAAYLQSRMDPFFLEEIVCYQLLPLPYSWPMWYLASQFVVYLVWLAMAWAAKKLGRSLPYNLLALAAVALLAFHMYHVEWQVLTGGTAWESKLVRNAWLDGFPFFALGAWFGRHQERIRSLLVKPLWGGGRLVRRAHPFGVWPGGSHRRAAGHHASGPGAYGHRPGQSPGEELPAAAHRLLLRPGPHLLYLCAPRPPLRRRPGVAGAGGRLRLADGAAVAGDPGDGPGLHAAGRGAVRAVPVETRPGQKKERKP